MADKIIYIKGGRLGAYGKGSELLPSLLGQDGGSCSVLTGKLAGNKTEEAL